MHNLSCLFSFRNFAMENYIHALGCAFQLSGALVLLITYWNSIDKIIDDKYSDNNMLQSERQDPDFITVPKCKCIEIACKVFLNRIAFIELALGFIPDFIVQPNEPLQGICLFILAAVLLTIVSVYFGKFLAKYYYNKDIKIPSINKIYMAPPTDLL